MMIRVLVMNSSCGAPLYYMGCFHQYEALRQGEVVIQGASRLCGLISAYKSLYPKELVEAKVMENKEMKNIQT